MRHNPLNKAEIAFVLAILSVLLLQIHSSTAQPADIILTNGNIFTADTSRRYVQALAIRGNRIIAIGKNREIEKLSSGRTEKFDLRGATVVPGFNNAHDHAMFLSSVGKYFIDESMSVTGITRKQLSDSVSSLVSKAHPGEWISGPIGLHILNDPTIRTMLDSLAPNNPVYLQAWWGHGCVINNAALDAVGIKDSDPDPSGGWYVKNSGHQITSLHENAQSPLWITHPASSRSASTAALLLYGRAQVAHGMTSIQYMGTGIDARDPSPSFKELSRLQRVRLIKWASSRTYRNEQTLWHSANPENGQMFNISGIKYLVDGTPMEGNALMSLHYPTVHGRLNYPVDTLREIIKAARDGHDQLILHAVGDSAVTTVISLMKELADPDLWRRKRVRIEHNAVETPSAELKKDLHQMGIMLMHTPKYAHSSPVKSLVEAGILVGIAPDGSANPFIDIAHITSRQHNPAENITREAAVIAYTYINAYAEFEEGTKGSLLPGMLADLVVLTNNIFTVPESELIDTKSQLTIVDGKVVFSTMN